MVKADYAELAATHPADLVLVGEVRCAADGIDHTYEMRAVRTLVERSPVITPC